MIRRNIFTLIIILCTYALHGQIIRGTITDKDNGRPVPDVLISIGNGTLSLQSDQEGRFIIDGLSPGRYILRFQHIQFQPILREVLLMTAKESVVNVQLETRTVALAEVTVSESRFTQVNSLNQITVEEVQRYPGTYFDPARFASTFPGVQIVNDQANQLVINGMSPDLMQWHLEGLEIVNPNHLANAGTLSDRPTATGGGVNMLSNQVLSNSSLLTGATGGYGNATSGIMDMYFRDGNTNKREHTIQVGLLGIEGATEGPFKKDGRSSYVVNARYSTIGLLSLMGVDLGDEQIHFGDISANTQFHIGQKGAKLKVFGFFGSNSNKFEAKDQAEWEEDKDRYNIDYTSKTGVIGATYTQPLSANGLFTLKSVLSKTQYDRLQKEPDAMDAFSKEEGAMNKWASEIQYSTILGARSRISGSVLFAQDYVDLERRGQDGSYFAYEISTLFRPKLDFKTSISNTISVKLGVGLARYDYLTKWNFEPEAEFIWQVKENQNITLRYKLSSQTMSALETIDSTEENRNSTLKPIRSHNIQLTYQLAVAGGIVELGAHYAALFDVPVDVVSNDYSALNIATHPNEKVLDNDGTGSALALSLGYRRNFTKSYFISGNASIISGKYKGSDGISRSTSFDMGYAIYTSGGKEWQKNKDYGMRTWGLNGGFILHGGLREGVIDPQASATAFRTEYVPGTMGDVQLGDYYRLDVRVYFRKDKAKHSSTISLDIQNLTGNENDWFSYYDQLFQEVRTNTQLGIIPILSWRLDF